MRAARRSALALLVSLSIAPAARGALAFNFTWGPNIPAGDLVNVQTATTYAALQITNNFSDNVVLNVTVDGMPTGLGMSSAPLVGAFTNAQINAFLNADKTTPDDTTAVANLPAADQTGGTNYLLARGLAKGLGQVAAADPATDGTFSYGTGNSYTFDPNNRAQSGKFDFIRVADASGFASNTRIEDARWRIAQEIRCHPPSALFKNGDCPYFKSAKHLNLK